MKGVLKSFDGERIQYTLQNSGRPIIFLHPLGMDWTYWKKSAEFFADNGFCAIMPTLRGHSSSPTKLRKITIDDHVLDIEMLIDKLKLKNPVLVGCSIGGAIASAYHKSHKNALCISINAPFDSAPKAIWLYYDLYALLFKPVAMFLSMFKRVDYDFSKSKVSNAVLLTFITALKMNYKGVYLNYSWLRHIQGVKDSGVVKIATRQDEVITPHYTPDYELDGNHNCVLSEPDVINKLLLKIIQK
jgi:pimeloyl-ACP methyl ester carboxylesterase